MDTTITLGKAGRLVVPKEIRDQLGLREGSKLRLAVSEGKLEFVPEDDSIVIEYENGFPVIMGGPVLRKGDLIEILKAERNSREEQILDAIDR